MLNFLSLPPSDFEALAADVLSTAFGVRFERFGEGRDGGIDCQYEHIEGSQRELWVGQAKRYSDVSALLRQMPEEQAKMQSLTKQPKRYFLVAACALLPQHKEQIKSAMQPYILSTSDIWGADDIEALFKAQPRLYARHHRLWLHSFGQLQQHLDAASFARSEAALAELYDRITCFVEHPQVGEIETQLAEHQACFIVGDPGSGKTTTAAEIAFRHCLIVKDTELHWFGDRSFGEALQLIRPGTKQLFVFDDCFGATFLTDNGALRYRQNWQALLHKAEQSNGELQLIFTSRDYILQQALSQMREPGRRIAKLVERAVRISPNTAAFRVDYVHQLFTASGLKPEQIEVLVSNELYWAMITDPKFSPRMLGRLFEELANVEKDDTEQFVLRNLSEPNNLWRKAFEDLSDEAKALTLLAGLTTSYNNETSLREAFFKFYFEKHNTHSSAQAFENALLEAEPVFITSKSQLDEIWISTANPGVNDFIYGELSNNTPLLEAVINSLTDFSWGIKTFSINPDTHFPLLLTAVQGKQLLDKLVELLDKPVMQLWQRQDTGIWEKRDVELGQKVAQLWRKAQHDTALSQWLFEKLMPQLTTQANWINELAVGDTASILDFSLYCDAETQQKIWNVLLKNIHNTQVAAALAEFYVQQPQAQQWFGFKRSFANKLIDACIDDIRWVDNPEYLDSMLEDLYQIEAALNVDIDDAKLLILEKLDPHEDVSDLKSDVPITNIYFVAPPSGHIDEALLAELAGMRGSVKKQFEELYV